MAFYLFFIPIPINARAPILFDRRTELYKASAFAAETVLEARATAAEVEACGISLPARTLVVGDGGNEVFDLLIKTVFVNLGKQTALADWSFV